MKTLVIHPFDVTTGFLEPIYSDHDNWTIVDYNVSNRELKEFIKSHDRIIMLGHGTELGLIGYGKFLVTRELVYLLQNKQCVCIWCNANVFVEKYNLKGFYTGMIISEWNEACLFNLWAATEEQILSSNHLFTKAIKESITDFPNMLNKAKEIYVNNDNNVIVEFNKRNLFQKE